MIRQYAALGRYLDELAEREEENGAGSVVVDWARSIGLDRESSTT